MAEKIDPTWLAYAFDRPVAAARIDAGLARLEKHYGGLVSYPLATHRATGERLGIAVLADAEPQCAWPHFADGEGLAIGTAYVPGGWEALVGPLAPADAPLPLARALIERPQRAAEALVGPAVLGILDEDAGRLVIANDCIGAGRLYETRLPGGRVWSNRGAAGLVFAGLPAEPDERGWRLLGAAGWFFGDSTPFRDVRKVPRGSVVEAGADGVTARETGAIGALVHGGGPVDEMLVGAARAAVAQVRLATSLWEREPVIHLSGGRDSRLVAAAAVAGRVDAVLRTSDNNPGEADVARRLVELAPHRMRHDVVHTEEGEGPETPLLERAVRGQLLHDGMRHASKVRRDVSLPRSRPNRATMPGWGGEIGHAFYYQDSRQLRKVRRRGVEGALKRLGESSRKKHNAAHQELYDLAEAEYRTRIEEGVAHGLGGPDLLDWFYMTERFVHRLEVGADSQGVSVFTTPAFIRAAFATRPEQRLDAHAHREITAHLVPAWRDVPYYKREAGPRPQLRRRRLWEAEDDARALDALVAGEGAWTELFRPARIREMWSELRSGGGYADWETVFERLAFREAFETYRAAVDRSAAAGEQLVEALAA